MSNCKCQSPGQPRWGFLSPWPTIRRIDYSTDWMTVELDLTRVPEVRGMSLLSSVSVSLPWSLIGHRYGCYGHRCGCYGHCYWLQLLWSLFLVVIIITVVGWCCGHCCWSLLWSLLLVAAMVIVVGCYGHCCKVRLLFGQFWHGKATTPPPAPAAATTTSSSSSKRSSSSSSNRSSSSTSNNNKIEHV